MDSSFDDLCGEGETSANGSSGSEKKLECQQDGEVDDGESEHFEKIVDAFLYYKVHSLTKLRRELLTFRRLPKKHQEMLPNYVDHLTHIRKCILANYVLLKSIVKDVDRMFENQTIDGESRMHFAASDFNMEKLQSTLRQMVRDWSSEGVQERSLCYKPILDDIERLWPPTEEGRSDVRILVPGAGLGRLAFDISRLGFTCEGNEFSLFMLFSSNFILNRCKSIDSWTIYPYIHQWTNNLTYADQIRPITIPDVDPSLLSSTNFSMSAGDFVQVYANVANSWDCVATVFFIDTARNVVAYMERIYSLLKPGGFWINLGPLLYHFAEISDVDSIQLPYDEVKEVAKKIGFELSDEQTGIEMTYTQNAQSMLKYKYECVKFLCRKPTNDGTEAGK